MARTIEDFSRGSRSAHLLLFVVLGLTALQMAVAQPALANGGFPYASVVCQGARALVRFTFSSDQDAPVFRGVAAQLPDPTARDLDGLSSDHPAQCTLSDGRTIVLRQGDKNDARGYGECGGQTTELFSLSVGDKQVYTREVWYHKCGNPYHIVAITIDNGRLTECQAGPEFLGASAPHLATCEDRSERLGRPGEMVLLRAARDMTSFCRGLIKDDGPAFPEPWATWPTYQRTGNQVIANGIEWEPQQEAGVFAPFDLSNSGTLSTAVVADAPSGGPNGDESVWSLLPADAEDDDVKARETKLQRIDEARAKQLRSSGIIVFAGDLTAFGRMQRVHLTPFRRDGTTYMLATDGLWPPTDLVVRPTPAGGLDEICAFKETPPL